MSSIEQTFIPYHAETRLGRGRMLVFAPHPDDEVLGCGGAILSHVAAGESVRVIIATDGAFGAADATAYAETRQMESRAAAAVLGYGEPEFWGLPDRGLHADEALAQRVAAALAAYAPALVLAPSWWEIHPDHTALSLAVTEAVRRSASGIHLALYEVGMPLHPNRLLDITASLPRKQAALACFVSQMTRQAYDAHILSLNRYRTYTLPAAVQAAEAYRCIEPLAVPEWLPAPLASRVDGPALGAGQAGAAAKQAMNETATDSSTALAAAARGWLRRLRRRLG